MPAPRSRGVARTTGHVRIIGGEWKRRTLPVIDAPGLRPTPDRVRETLFNWLSHAFEGSFAGRSALDLYAGTGALGFEAASRGAGPVVLVEHHPAALAMLRQARTTLAAARTDIQDGDAITRATMLQVAGRTFDVIFLDPPFGQRHLENALPLAAVLCEPSGFVYVEAEHPLIEAEFLPLGLEAYRTAKAGEVFYHLLRRNKKE